MRFENATKYEALLIEITKAAEHAGGLIKSREAALVATKLDEARLWLEEYGRKQNTASD